MARRIAPVAVGMADDGYVLEYRNFDEGKNPFAWNVDRKTMTPLYMFDAAKVGAKALRAEDIGNPAKPGAIVKEANAVPFDPNADWKEGDILPGRLISRTDAKGSAADNDAAYGTWKDGTYTLVWRRKLDTGHPADDKVMKVGGRYTVGFAIHDDNVTTRFHHVSFPLTLGIGVDADFKAVTLKLCRQQSRAQCGGVNAEPSGLAVDVRFGSKADMAANQRDVRFTPDSRHSSAARAGRLLAARLFSLRPSQPRREGGTSIKPGVPKSGSGPPTKSDLWLDHQFCAVIRRSAVGRLAQNFVRQKAMSADQVVARADFDYRFMHSIQWVFPGEEKRKCN